MMIFNPPQLLQKYHYPMIRLEFKCKKTFISIFKDKSYNDYKMILSNDKGGETFNVLIQFITNQYKNRKNFYDFIKRPYFDRYGFNIGEEDLNYIFNAFNEWLNVNINK